MLQPFLPQGRSNIQYYCKSDIHYTISQMVLQSMQAVWKRLQQHVRYSDMRLPISCSMPNVPYIFLNLILINCFSIIHVTNNSTILQI